MFSNLKSLKNKKVGVLENVPNNVSYLSKKKNELVEKADIIIKFNEEIQHTSIENYKEREYYEDYFMTLSYSNDIQNLQNKQITRLLLLHRKYHNDSNSSFLEVGCGDGDFLIKASNVFNKALGVEPSSKFYQFAKDRGANVINKYIDSKEKICEYKFSAFASRQVFEHLDDPLDVLIGIKKNLKRNAVGFIEVPNGMRSFRHGRFYDFFPDHVNYYSVNSLVALATSAGFNVIGCNEALNSDYLELWLLNSCDSKKYFQELIQQRDKIIHSLSGFLENNSSNSLSIWGGGAKTISILSALNGRFLQKISYVIDSDLNKQGLYIPNSDIEIVSSDDAITANVNIIIILALSHSKEIFEQIQSSFPYKTTVVSIGDDGNIYNMNMGIFS
jgi:SAM-dependent methyltransferase